MKKEKSVKSHVMRVLLGMMTPLVFFILGYSFYMMAVLNEKVADSNKNALLIFCNGIENELDKLDREMTRLVALDNEFKFLTRRESELDAHIHSYDILQEYDALLDISTILDGCMIISHPNDIIRSSYADSFEGITQKETLESFFQEYTSSEKMSSDPTWKPLCLQDQNYIYLIKGYDGVYSVFFISEDTIIKSGAADIIGQMVLFDTSQIMHIDSDLTQHGISLKNLNHAYFTGNLRNYMIMEKQLSNTDIQVAYITSYKGAFGNLNHWQIAVFAVSLLTVLIIPMGYYELKKYFLRPIDSLISTMNKIKTGYPQARIHTEFSETEFSEMAKTFNLMMDQIEHLRNEAYEKELNLKRIELQYYQIQIKPHFYLNCLKNIYSMVAEKKYDPIKESIIYLSNHLRYMLKNDFILVPIQTELKYVENYISLQRLNDSYPIEIEKNVSKELEKELIPQISILSFVENSVKHVIRNKNKLQISVYIQNIIYEGKKCINIHIADNGQGFSQEQLKCLNRYQQIEKPTESIGIYNVIQRFILSYGKDGVLFAFYNQNGANTDIFIRRKPS